MVNLKSSRFQKNALLWYFFLAFLISWIFWFIEPHLREQDSLLATFFIQLGSYGPILAAMFISIFSSPEKTDTLLRPRLLAGGLALGVVLMVIFNRMYKMPDASRLTTVVNELLSKLEESEL